MHADFGRVIAEFWADGPDSETPPGHWNTLANAVSDTADIEHRIGGVGPTVDRLEWDVKPYFALNGAVHDAAIAAWGAKAVYDYVRPISMIRHMGGAGQSTDSTVPGYDPHGLPLEPGVVELITAESSAPGERHEHLAEHVGDIAVLPGGAIPRTRLGRGGVGWIRAVEWVPYQRPSFVTPAFAGYVSGHSTFSRAGAEVLTAITGDEFFPGGIFEWKVQAGSLGHENGPADDVTLQWATYYDAADEAGISRLYGGIHVAADDYRGRIMGSSVGSSAWRRPRSSSTVRPDPERSPSVDGSSRRMSPFSACPIVQIDWSPPLPSPRRGSPGWARVRSGTLGLAPFTHTQEETKMHRLRKRTAWLVMMLALVLVAAACGDDDDDDTTTTAAAGEETTTTAAEVAKRQPPLQRRRRPRPPRRRTGPIWVLLPDSASSPRWETDDRRFFEEAFTEAGVDHTIVNAEGDAATQQSQAEQAIASGASVIVMTSLDLGSGGAIIEPAKAAGIQVLEYDRFNTGSSGGAVYVSFDNVAVGATMAEVLTPLIDGLGDTPATS